MPENNDIQQPTPTALAPATGYACSFSMQATLDLGNGETRRRDFNGKANVKDDKTATLATLLAGILTGIEREEALNQNMIKVKITASLCRHNAEVRDRSGSGAPPQNQPS